MIIKKFCHGAPFVSEILPMDTKSKKLAELWSLFSEILPVKIFVIEQERQQDYKILLVEQNLVILNLQYIELS